MYKLVDCDRHITEPLAMWREFVDPSVYNDYPVSIEEKEVVHKEKKVVIRQAKIGEHYILNKWSEEIQLAALEVENDGKKERYESMHPVSQLRTMNESGVDKAYLFPAFTMNIVNHSEIPSHVSIAYANAYNHWLEEYSSLNKDRLRAVGVVSRKAPGLLVEQAEKIYKRGLSSITIRPEPISGYAVGDKNHHDFYKFCSDNNIAIVFHGGTHLCGSTVGSDRFNSRIGLHACAHPMELQMAFLSLLESGVLEKNPRLKIGFVEGGCSWVPHWLWRLDNICYSEFPSLVSENIKMLPSEYFKRHCWVDFEVGEPCIDEFVNLVGHEKLIFGTDFPHPDHLDFDFKEAFGKNSGLSEDQIRDIFENNPLDLFEGVINA